MKMCQKCNPTTGILCATHEAVNRTKIERWWSGLTTAQKKLNKERELCGLQCREKEEEEYAQTAFEWGDVKMGELHVKILDRIRAIIKNIK